jgi:hypothetical protein
LRERDDTQQLRYPRILGIGTPVCIKFDLDLELKVMNWPSCSAREVTVKMRHQNVTVGIQPLIYLANYNGYFEGLMAGVLRVRFLKQNERSTSKGCCVSRIVSLIEMK